MARACCSDACGMILSGRRRGRGGCRGSEARERLGLARRRGPGRRLRGQRIGFHRGGALARAGSAKCSRACSSRRARGLLVLPLEEIHVSPRGQIC